MYEINEAFQKSKGQPIVYKGKTLVMGDELPLPARHTRIFFRIISTDSEWKQGMALRTDGELTFEGRQVIKSKWADIWEKTSPTEGEFTCRSNNQLLEVKNIWDRGDGCIESWHNGSAIWIEDIPGGRRYHCNDGHFDEDFDDIVFELSVVGVLPEKDVRRQ